MSLFGGGDLRRQALSSLENDSLGSSSTAPTAPSSLNSYSEDFPSAQPTSYLAIDVEDKDDEDYVEGEEDYVEDELDESEELDMDDASRHNRFTGKPKSWRRFTAAERQITASLDQAQSGDLAAHLYNTHALKQRVRLPTDGLQDVKDWQHKGKWLKKGQELEFMDILGDTQRELVPHKRWTAWPLPPTIVPTANERFGRRPLNMDHEWTVGGLGEQKFGDELREEVLAMFLRLAKEQWLNREVKVEFPEVQKKPSPKPRPWFKNRRIAPKRLQPSALDPDQVHSDVGVHVEDNSVIDEMSATETEGNGKSSRRERDPKLERPSRQAVFLADDDTARQILQPTIDSLLVQLDGVATALRVIRLNHFVLAKGTHTDTSASEFTSGAESSRPASRSSAKNRSRNASTRMNSSSRAASRAPSETSLTLTSAGKRTSGPNSAINTNGVMDWSEVLGAASMTGWNENVIARTAQRCAALFSESMTFRALNPDITTGSVPDPVQYTPTVIPVPNILGNASTSKRPYLEPGTLRCPHKDCARHYKNFGKAVRTIQHIKTIHGYDPRTNDSDNEERGHGGVHIDGFLRPISIKSGWVRRNRPKSESERPSKKRKIKKKEVESEPASPGADPSILSLET